VAEYNYPEWEDPMTGKTYIEGQRDDIVILADGQSSSASQTLRFHDWVTVLEKFENLVRRITRDRLDSQSTDAAPNLVVSGLSKQSPATVTLSFDAYPTELKEEVLDSLRTVMGGGELHETQSDLQGLSVSILNSAEDFFKAATRSTVSCTLGLSGDQYPVTSSLSDAVKRELESYVVETEVEGRLDQVSLHNTSTKRFAIWPTIDHSVRCQASPEVESQLVAALKKWVAVEGTVSYRANSNIPTKIDRVKSVRVIEVPSDPDAVIRDLQDLFTPESLREEFESAWSGWLDAE